MSVSDIGRQILEYGLKADPKKELDIPIDYQNLAREVYDVPEKPLDFEPNFPEVEYIGTALLVSGGLDSSVSWLMTRKEMGDEYPQAFYVNMGQPYARKELQALTMMDIPFELIEIPEPAHLKDGKWKHIHPGRNFYYLSLVAERVRRPSRLVLSAVDGEITKQGGDKSRVFFREANRLFAQLPKPVKVITPLETMTKTDLVAWAIENNKLDVVKETISCFSEEPGRCGKCQSCLRTWIAFYNNGIELDFIEHPFVGGQEYVQKYKRVMSEALERSDYSHYSQRRITQTLGAFSRYEGK